MLVFLGVYLFLFGNTSWKYLNPETRHSKSGANTPPRLCKTIIIIVIVIVIIIINPPPPQKSSFISHTKSTPSFDDDPSQDLHIHSLLHPGMPPSFPRNDPRSLWHRPPTHHHDHSHVPPRNPRIDGNCDVVTWSRITTRKKNTKGWVY